MSTANRSGQLILFGPWLWGMELKGHRDRVCKVSGKKDGGGKICEEPHQTNTNKTKLWLSVVPLHWIIAVPLGASSSEAIKAI